MNEKKEETMNFEKKVNSKIENLNKQLKDKNDEKNKMEKNHKEKINKLNKELKAKDDERNNFEKMYKYEIEKRNEIINKMTEDKNQLYNEVKKLKYLEEKQKNFLSNINEKNIKESIEKLYKIHLENKKKNVDKDIESVIKNNQYFLKKINEWKDKVIEKTIQEFIKKTKHINIILVGKTGVGKSTLINAFLGEEIAQTGGFNPVTFQNDCYESGVLRFWDTQGIELSKNNNVDIVFNNAKDLITKSEKKDPDWFIHCIWYCVSGRRFEKPEHNVIIKLMNSYSDETMPIIILYLQALSEDGIKDMKEGLEDTFKNRKIDFIPVLAKDEETQGNQIIKKFGLEETIIATLNRFKQSIDSMSFIYVHNKVLESINREVEKIVDKKDFSNISKSICNYFSKLMDLLDEKTIKIINTSIDNILLSCKSEIDYSDEILRYIYIFKNQLKKEKNNLSQNEINNIINNIEKELEIKYNKIKVEYYKNNIPTEIFKYYVELVQKISKSIVTDNLKDIKNTLIAKMQKEIENSPNFNNIFKKRLNN